MHASLMLEYEGKVIDVNSWSQGKYDGLDPFPRCLEERDGHRSSNPWLVSPTGQFGLENKGRID